MKSALSIIDSISKWSGKNVGYLVVVVTGLVTLEVVLRYAFNSPTTWNTELVIYLCGALYTVGGAYVLYLGGHVKVDVIYMRLTPRTRATLDLVTIPLFLTFCGVLLWFGGEWTWKALIGGTTSGSAWSPIIFPVRLLIPLAAFLLLLQGLAKFIRDFHIAVKRKNSEH